MANLTLKGKQTQAFQQLQCSPTLIQGSHQHLIFLSSFNTILSITAFLGNGLILSALRKESSLHPPSKLLYRCLATTDLFVGIIAEPLKVAYFMALAHEKWTFCPYARDSSYIASYILSGVSLLTMTAISVDRLLALLLGLRYRQVVTLKRTYLVAAAFWIISTVVAMAYFRNHLLTIWGGNIVIPSCLAVSFLSYSKIFHILRHRQTRVQDHMQLQQPSQGTPLNIGRYKKAVSSALWVQLTLAVCYLPFGIMAALLSNNGLSSSNFFAWELTVTVLYLNSSLNPFLYCWKIREVKQAVKETIREALCCSFC